MLRIRPSRFATHRTSRSTDVMENVSYTCPIERVSDGKKIAVDAHMLAMNQYSTRGGGAAADPRWGGRLAPLVLTPSSGHAPASQR